MTTSITLAMRFLMLRYLATHQALMALIIAAALLASSCTTTTTTRRRPAITQLAPHDPELQAQLWRRSSVLKAALELCGVSPGRLDGGGSLSITVAGVMYPALSLDWVYAQGQLTIEVADATGATPFKLLSDAHHAQLIQGSRTTELQWTKGMPQPRWSYQGHDLLMNHHDLGCLLAGGIPPSWQLSQGRWRLYRKASLFQGRLAGGHHLRLTHRLPRQQLCMEVRRRRWWALLHTKRFKICYHYSAGQSSAVAAEGRTDPSSRPLLISAHLELNHYKVRISHRPEEGS